MEEKTVVKIPVRKLVETAMKSGDISLAFAGTDRMAEGTRTHRAVQMSYTAGYAPEVPVSYAFVRDGICVEVSGRIDGIIEEHGEITIDEIKSTMSDTVDIENSVNPLHLAQAKCYGYIYCMLNDMDAISVQVTYCSISTGNLKSTRNKYTVLELEEFFMELIDKYLKQVRMVMEWRAIRDSSIKGLEFPYPSYRKGQRKFAVAVYRAIKDREMLFAQSPTGTGKTIASLYPSVKAIGEGIASSIFYLTARGTTGEAAIDALGLMKESGLRFKSMVLTAKEKACPSPGCSCSPDECRFARGYYDRVDDAIYDIFNHDTFTRERIEEFASKHTVCPFEFSLDLSYFCDIVICDYNYVFDPRVYLKRFFAESGDYIFLIDEAHNLVDRAREMYSSGISKRDVLDLKRSIKDSAPDIYRALNKINGCLIKYDKECKAIGSRSIVKVCPPEDIYPYITDFTALSEKFLMSHDHFEKRDELLDMYFSMSFFMRISELYDERYSMYFEAAGNDRVLKLYCMDPSYLLKQHLKKGSSSVFFSATLSPSDYFVNCLGGDENSRVLNLPSPFPPDNLCLMVDNKISTRYQDRETTYDDVSSAIYSAVSGRAGNYLIFFPSYKYMNEVYARFAGSHPDIRTILQASSMDDMQRDEFLDNFREGNSGTLSGFAVMGGLFSEGIDLKGDMLSGVVVVGVGLPQVCLERDIIRDYYQNLMGLGFEYGYAIPGMNRVMQSVGRVIRTERDRGIALLIDERFSYPLYKKMFPNEWRPRFTGNVQKIESIAKDFWNERG